MFNYWGILFAFIALISWGFGDFFIQKSTRVVGSWKSLFFIGIVGLVGLFPFVKQDLMFLDGGDFLLLGLLGLVVVFAALFDFEALRRGKISIVEPVIGLELPITVGLSVVLANESLSILQFLLIGVVFLGIVLAVIEHKGHVKYNKIIFERGVILAGVGSMGMALTNFLVGVSSQDISPIVTIWFSHSLLAIICGGFIFLKGEFGSIVSGFKANPRIIIGQSVLDNVAWLSFAVSTTYIPIAIATTISESYIALAVLLGLFVGHERLKTHQVAGVFIAMTGVVILSYFSS